MAFTYNTVKETSSVNDFTMLDYAEAADDATVIFHMTRPFSIWPYTMAITGIVPEHAYDPATYGSNPIGSGRYVLKQWDPKANGQRPAGPICKVNLPFLANSCPSLLVYLKKKKFL